MKQQLKIKLLLVLSLLLSICGSFSSCQKYDLVSTERLDIEFPTYYDPDDLMYQILVEELLKMGLDPPKSNSKWKGLKFDNKTVIVINSDHKLEQYLDDPNKYYPNIDFSKHTLLLTSGTCSSISAQIRYKLYIHSGKCRLNVEYYFAGGWFNMSTYWALAIITDKLNDDANIELNIKKICPTE